MRPDPPIPQRPEDILLDLQFAGRVLLGAVVLVHAGDEHETFSCGEETKLGEEERGRFEWGGREEGGEEEGDEDSHTSFDYSFPVNHAMISLSPPLIPRKDRKTNTDHHPLPSM